LPAQARPRAPPRVRTGARRWHEHRTTAQSMWPQPRPCTMVPGTGQQGGPRSQEVAGNAPLMGRRSPRARYKGGEKKGPPLLASNPELPIPANRCHAAGQAEPVTTSAFPDHLAGVRWGTSKEAKAQGKATSHVPVAFTRPCRDQRVGRTGTDDGRRETPKAHAPETSTRLSRKCETPVAAGAAPPVGTGLVGGQG